MFGFLKKKKQYDNYYDCLIVVPWSEYQSFDKYQKITSFTLEGIEDSIFLREVLSNLIESSITGRPLSKDLHKKLQGLQNEIDFVDWLYRYRHIANIIKRYWQQKELTTMVYWRIGVGQSKNTEEIKLDNFVEHRDHDFFRRNYPPNFFYDHSDVRSYSEQQLEKRYPNRKKASEVVFTPEADFDYNIPEYLYEHYGIKE